MKNNYRLFNYFAFLAAMVLWLWYALPVFELAFRDDDTHIMRVALSYPWYDFLTRPPVYQELSTAHYTPWIIWSYQLDFFLAAGPDKLMFYLHQWFAVSLMISLYSLIAWKLSGRPEAAAFTALLLVTQPSLLSLLTENYTRHYIEGSILFCFSILAALRWLDNRGWHWWLLAVLLFALSLLAKEIFLIAPLLLFWLPQFRTRKALTLFTAFAALNIVYLWLRSYMLGTSGGGMHGVQLFSLLPGIFSGLPVFMDWFIKTQLALIIFTSMAILVSRQKLNTVLWLFLSLGLILGPGIFAPGVWVDPYVHADRVYILLYPFLALFSAVILSQFVAREALPDANTARVGQWRVVALAGLLVWGVVVGIQNQAYTKHQAESASTLIASELLNPASLFDTLITPKGFRLGELVWINRYFERPAPDLLLTEQDIISSYQQGSKIGQYDPDCHCIKRLAHLDQKCSQLANDKDFQTDFNYQDGIISWNLKHHGVAKEAGIIFLERHIVIPAPFYSARFSRPRAGEAYRFYFIGADGFCWLGPVAAVALPEKQQ